MKHFMLGVELKKIKYNFGCFRQNSQEECSFNG